MKRAVRVVADYCKQAQAEGSERGLRHRAAILKTLRRFARKMAAL